jgi:hypothetical protein
MAEIGQITYKKFGLAPYSYQILYFVLKPKIDEDILKSLPPKKTVFLFLFFEKGGGGILLNVF